MTVTQIAPRLYTISLGPFGVVNAFLLDQDGLTLIDTGLPGSAKQILAAVRAIGRTAADVRHILLTHCHPDHSGSLQALKHATGAPAAMHPLDAALVRAGQPGRPAQMRHAPGLRNAFISQMFMALRPANMMALEMVEIEQELQDGDEHPAGGGLHVMHTPGHTLGHLSFYWPQHGGVLFAADTASNQFGLGYVPSYEDLATGLRSLNRLSELEFEIACFGHGRAIVGGAAARFRQKWGRESVSGERVGRDGDKRTAS